MLSSIISKSLEAGRRYWLIILRCKSLLIISLMVSGYISATEITRPDQIRQQLIFKPELIIGPQTESDDQYPHRLFFRPRSFTFDEQGNCYILDSGNCRVQVFTAQGKFLHSFGRSGEGPGELSQNAHRIRYFGGKIYIFDLDLFRLIIFDKHGTYLQSFDTKIQYQNLVVYKHGNIVLADLRFAANYSPLQVYDVKGNCLYQFGKIEEPVADYFKNAQQECALQTIFLAGNPPMAIDNEENIYFYQEISYNIKNMIKMVN